MSDTPRTLALNLRLGHADDATAQRAFHDLAEQLERELAAAQAEIAKLKTPTPCAHSELHGWVSNNESDSWCAKCGKKFGPNKLLGSIGSSR